mgnify:CR=1 FL=1
MKKKLLSLLTLLLCVCSGAWAETVTVTLTGSTTKDGATTAFVPTISSSNANITTGTCGSSCANSGYILSTAGNKTFTYDETTYYLCHVYASGSKEKLNNAGLTNQYGTFTVGDGYKYTISRIDYVLATNSIDVNDVIIIKDASSNNKYSSGNISVTSSASPVSGSKTSLSTELTAGTYTINLNMSNSNTSTGKYFGFAKIIITGNLEATKSITSQVFGGVKIDGVALNAAKYTVEGTTITLADSYVLAPTVKLINSITYSDETTGSQDVAVSLAANGDFYEGTATIDETTYTVKVPKISASVSNISWAFADQGTTLTPTYTSTDKIASGTVTFGSNVSYDGENYDYCFVDSEGEDKVYVSRIKPSEASNNTITFTITPTLGAMFTPTSVSFVAMKQGTNNAVTLDAAWISEGHSEISLASAVALKRASSSGIYATPGGDRLTYNLVEKGAATATGTFGLKLTLNTATRSYGIGEIIISGYLIGSAITQSVSVGAKGYATYCNSSYALDFTGKSIKAYTISSADGSALTLTQKNKVAKNEPVLLYSSTNSDSQTIPAIADGDATATVDNKLVAGTGAALTWTENTAEHYILYTGGANPGFFRANNSTVAVGKAYLDLTGLSASARSFDLNMDGGEATGIDAINNGPLTMDKAVYDLQGREVVAPTKGLYILNGKKVMIK